MKLKGHRNNPYFLYLSDIATVSQTTIIIRIKYLGESNYSNNTRAGSAAKVLDFVLSLRIFGPQIC